jgi:hypothetical protein
MLRELAAFPTVEETDAPSRAGALSTKDAIAMSGMLDRMVKTPLGRRLEELTEKQRRYVAGVYERVTGTPTYENLVSSGKVNLGSYGKTERPAVLRGELPKKPPGRR